MSKSGNDLVLKIRAIDQMTFAGWYSSGPSIDNLQIIAEAMSTYNAGSSESLRNDQVELFNFANIVSAFDSSSTTTDWQISDATLAAYQLDSGQVGIKGGDFAIDYGLNGFFNRD